jgi:hypothetical protein
MCFSSDPPQAPNNAPTYSTDQAKAASAAAEIAKDPTADDSLQASKVASSQDTTASQSKNSGAMLGNLRM